MTTTLSCSLEAAVDALLARVDGPIRLALPLGLGKPNRLVNALYRRIAGSPGRRLTIYTALSLGRPATAANELERRFSEPLLARLYGDYPELDYLRDLRGGCLPDNIQIEEFYFQPGSLLGNADAQQRYVSTNYSQVVRDLAAKDINVIAQLVARDPRHGDRLSLSCNPDLTKDLLARLRHRAGGDVLFIAQAHAALPYMPGYAELPAADVDVLIEPAETSTLFSTPNLPVGDQDHAIGVYASALVRDGGTLQIGIGAMGDAVAGALLARQRDNAGYRALLAELGAERHWGQLIAAEGGSAGFDRGLYACSEMLVPGLLALAEAGVVKRRVYDDARLQRLADAGALDAQGQPVDLPALAGGGRLGEADLRWLQAQGLLAPAVGWSQGRLALPDGSRIAPDLSDPACCAALRPWLGAAAGAIIHGGFFLGPQAFYRQLRELSPSQRAQIRMAGISFINRLYGDEELKRAQRRSARFINSVFTVTLLGAGVADQLENGQVISGVGGQYDFVAQGLELEGARSILLLRSWRERDGEARSNIVWQYGHATIPRHLRDIVITEYGIADLRGKADAQVIEALLRIADSRFQDALIQQAQAQGKLPAEFRLDAAFRDNTPQRLAQALGRHRALCPEYPLGCDFTPEEQALLRALNWLKRKVQRSEIVELGKAALFDAGEPADYAAHLRRMGLEQAEGIREQLYQRLLLTGLQATAAG